MIEIIRRLVLLVCLILAVCLFFQTQNLLYETAPVDFSALQQESSDKDLPPDEFITGEVKDRLVEVSGSQWEIFFNRTTDVLVNKSPAGDWKDRVSIGWKEGRALYFKPDEAPIREIQGELVRIARTSLLAYASLKNSQPPLYLSIRTMTFGDAKEYASPTLLYPSRPFSLWLVLAGIAVYSLLPWRRPKPGSIAYPLRSNIIPLDIVGMLIFLGFFTLPFFVITNTLSQPDVFDSGWVVFTIVCWLMSLLGLVLVGAALLNAIFWVEIQPDKLVINNLKGRGEYPFQSMERFEHTAIHLSRGVRFFLQLLVIPLFLSRQFLGAMALNNLIKQQQNSLAIHMKDGRRVQIWDNALPGFDRIETVLREQKIAG